MAVPLAPLLRSKDGVSPAAQKKEPRCAGVAPGSNCVGQLAAPESRFLWRGSPPVGSRSSIPLISMNLMQVRFLLRMAIGGKRLRWRPSYYDPVINSSTRLQRHSASTNSRLNSLHSRRNHPTKSQRSLRSRASSRHSRGRDRRSRDRDRDRRSLHSRGRDRRSRDRDRRSRRHVGQIVSRPGGFPCRRHRTSPN